MTDHFDFSHALSLLKQGKRVAREAWSQGSWMEMVRDSDGQPDVRARHSSGTDHPCCPTVAAMFADDWHEVTG